MSISLDISDGTTTVTLSGTAPVLGCTYFPATATLRDGAYQPVTETAEVNLRGTAAAIRATINSLETLLRKAAQRQATGAGDRVFVDYAPVSEAAYRSEVLDGRVVWTTEPGLRRLGDTNPTVRVAVIWTRAPGWDGGENELQISAAGHTAGTGGQPLLNNPGNGNWLQIAAAQIGGNLPAPMRLELTNNTGGSVTYYKLFLAVNANSDPANLVHFLQAEARTAGGTVTADGSCSGGSKLAFTPAASPITFTWTLPAADLARTKGRRARLLARFAFCTGPTYVTPAIQNAAGVTVWTGDEVALGALAGESWQDLGIVPLPPGGYAAGYGGMLLALTFRGAAVTELDVLQLTMLDSYRAFAIPSVAVANASIVVHDGMEGLAYVLTGAAKAPLATTFGGALLLEPGVINRIYVLYQTSTGAPIGGGFSAKVFYRARRLTV